MYAQKHSFIQTVYVSTDDAEIKKVALDFGAKVIDGPPHLSGDFEPNVSAFRNIIESIDDDIENVILLQAINPLRPENLVAEAFKLYLKNDLYSLFTVSRNNQKLGKIVNQKFVSINYTSGQRSQDLELNCLE